MTESGRRPRRTWLFRALYAVYAVAVIGGGLWLYGWFQIPETDPDGGGLSAVWRHYYPELWESGARPRERKADGPREVLLLGASVLEQVAPVLEKRLKEEFGDGVRVYNLARSAHTTQDSLLKSQVLEPFQFDLVIVYHGINDARMNYCPQEDFRADYTHVTWYRGQQRRLAAGRLVISDVLSDQFRSAFPLGEPSRQNWAYGADIKTRAPFRDHLAGILDRARETETPVLLMTFAYWLPEDYTLEKFNAHTLGYGRGAYELGAELWGDPQYLPAIIDAHNDGVRELADEPGVQFVDQLALLPRSGETFSDPCHLTDAGCRRFVDNIWPIVLQTLSAEKPPVSP